MSEASRTPHGRAARFDCETNQSKISRTPRSSVRPLVAVAASVTAVRVARRAAIQQPQPAAVRICMYVSSERSPQQYVYVSMHNSLYHVPNPSLQTPISVISFF